MVYSFHSLTLSHARDRTLEEHQEHLKSTIDVLNHGGIKTWWNKYRLDSLHVLLE